MPQPKQRFESAFANLLSSISGQSEKFFLVPREIAEFMGSVEGGVFLSQVVNWYDWAVNVAGRKDGMFWKSNEDWRAELLMSDYSVRKWTKELEERGLLETEIKKANGAPTKHYFLDYNALLEALADHFTGDSQMDSLKSTNRSVEINERTRRNQQNLGSVEINESITETNTTETNSETNTEKDTNNARVPEDEESETAESSNAGGFAFSSSDWEGVKEIIGSRITSGMYEGLVKDLKFEFVRGDQVVIRAQSKNHAERINGLLQGPVQKSLEYYLNHVRETPTGSVSFRAVA